MQNHTVILLDYCKKNSLNMEIMGFMQKCKEL